MVEINFNQMLYSIHKMKGVTVLGTLWELMGVAARCNILAPESVESARVIQTL